MTESAPPSSLDNPLWQFSLDFYGQPQVQEFLLECQEHKQADVCLLLWASYATACGRRLSEESWKVADRGLSPRRKMIASVRHFRRWLGGVHPRMEYLYNRCKRYEQKLEQRQLAALWKLQSETWPEDKSALELAGQHYGLLQKDQARWAGLIDAFNASAISPASK